MSNPRVHVSASGLAYVLLLMAFAALGLFVAALATGSGLAVVAGLVLIACLAGSVAGFRAAARMLAQTIAQPDSAVSIFSRPLRQDEIDRYLERYRGQSVTIPPTEERAPVLVGGKRTGRDAMRDVNRPQRRAEASLLSA